MRRVICLQTSAFLARRRNIFAQLLNEHEVNDVRQAAHTAEPLVTEPSAFQVEMAIEKLRRHKPPDIDESRQNLLKQGVEKFALKSINLLNLSGIRRNFLRGGRSRSLYLSIRRVIKPTIIIEAYNFCQLLTNFM
jgi:hypothetical protein